MTTGATGKGKRLTPEQRQDILANKGKVTGTELAKKHSVNKKTVYSIWAKGKAAPVKKAPKASGAKKTRKGAKKRRLTPEQRQQIIENRGKMTVDALARQHGIGVSTVYKIWKEGPKTHVKKAATSKQKVAQKAGANPNQRRKEFCRKWIAILEAEVKRIENEEDYLAEAEAILTKVISNR